jgi:hypothetical protein
MNPMKALSWMVVAVALLGPCLEGQPKWWMDTPVRLVQTNLRETDGRLDPARLVKDIAEFPANALLIGMGGIVSWYPTRLDYHYPSRYVPAGRDLFGEVLKEAHARNIRVVGRFDLSKTQKPVFDAHPEWFFRRSNGEPVIYNGLYSTCINGGYYRDHALKILTEALSRYEVDGLFFNMFGNPSADYSGNPVGLCHCQACESRFRERYGRGVPERPDADYRQFMAAARDEVSRTLGELIHRIRPRAAYLTYTSSYTDGIVSESNTAVDRALPLWPYSASDNVERAGAAGPAKMALNLCIGFVDIPYRMASAPPPEIRLRLFQNMAHGAGPAFVALGTLDQQDASGVNAAREVFAWHRDHQDIYAGSENAARVLLLAGRESAYRGFFRMLSELHVPFAVGENGISPEKLIGKYDLVVAPDGAPKELEAFVRQGGRLLAAGVEPPAFLGLQGVRRWDRTRSAYLRVHDLDLLPSLRTSRVLLLDGPYLELPPLAKPLLTLIPPAMFGPPELVGADAVETDKPGLILTAYGKGTVAYLPWDTGSLYYRLSPPAHRALVTDLIDRLLPKRQIRTGAHPLVEITVMRQPGRNRTLVHLVNLSGHSQTGYFPALTMRDIAAEVDPAFRRAYSVKLGKSLPIAKGRFVLPELGEYDAVILE